MRRLLAANAALAAVLAGHIADHVLRQPADEQLGLLASLPGLLGAAAVFVLLGLVVRRVAIAPVLAAGLGLLTAAASAASISIHEPASR